MKNTSEQVETGPGDHYIRLGREYMVLGDTKAAARFIACGQWINELATEVGYGRGNKSTKPKARASSPKLVFRPKSL